MISNEDRGYNAYFLVFLVRDGEETINALRFRFRRGGLGKEATDIRGGAGGGGSYWRIICLPQQDGEEIGVQKFWLIGGDGNRCCLARFASESGIGGGSNRPQVLIGGSFRGLILRRGSRETFL